MGRLLAVDYGQKKIGLAVTDPLKLIAQALDTVHVSKIHEFIKQYCEKEEVDYFVVGWPLNLDGEPAESCKYIAPFIQWLKKSFPDRQVVLEDERYTSVEAHRTILQAGVKKMKRRDKFLVDKISATIILQAHMDTLK